jgi:hypothetical protein
LNEEIDERDKERIKPHTLKYRSFSSKRKNEKKGE